MQPADKPAVSKTFLERFNAAASLAREGKYEAALKAYAQIHAPFADRGEARVMTSGFLGLIELGKAYCYIKMRKMERARELFESKVMRTAHTQLARKTLYEYYFLYGNTLGNLGMIMEMDDVLKKALQVALHDLGDSTLCAQAWYWLLYWGKHHKEWVFLEDQCHAARAFGVKHGDREVQEKAQEFICYAYRGLGKIEKARRCAEEVIRKKRMESESSPGAVKEWKTFLGSLDATEPHKH